MIFRNGSISLDSNPNRNITQIDNLDFRLVYLNGTDSGKGANSSIFILRDPNGDEEDRVIKICNTPLHFANSKSLERFGREIKAFQVARKHNLSKVIKFYGTGVISIDTSKFKYIIFEKANSDLSQFMESNNYNFSINQKLTFCHNILAGVRQLHEVDIYHRDIKHDNILVVNNEFKIGDLGLIRFRTEDLNIDDPNAKIGPYGWLSPEATNKIFTYRKKMPFAYDCDINNVSDVFQLGKLFWFIFQGNLPLGQILEMDCNIKEPDIFSILFSMLQYDKARRPDIKQLEKQFAPVLLKYGA